MTDSEFTRFVQAQSGPRYREMPWRQDVQPYYVLVSELMLQQTQVERVKPKFTAFIERFPSVESLAAAPLSEVLACWNGLGYNRRAKYLWQAAQSIVREHACIFPQTQPELEQLSGVGPNTAGAILAYAYNQPAVFIETNIRTVYIHHFFATLSQIDDTIIRQKLAATLPKTEPRNFYWALMDYGSWLKANGVKYNAKSAHYVKQSPLEGSVRQMRGMLLRSLIASDRPYQELEQLYLNDSRFESALRGLIVDGLVVQHNGMVCLTGSEKSVILKE